MVSKTRLVAILRFAKSEYMTTDGKKDRMDQRDVLNVCLACWPLSKYPNKQDIAQAAKHLKKNGF
jgi:hypothetical protein